MPAEVTREPCPLDTKTAQPDTWTLGPHSLHSRLLIGSALYPSPDIMRDSIQASGADVVTVSLRRQSPSARGGERFWSLIQETGLHVLPNTAGCRTAEEAVTTAHMAREMFGESWIKLEVIGDDYTLQPDTRCLVEAARILVADGFHVLPYTTDDLVVAHELVEVGCCAVMPWAAPIGSGRGVISPFALETLRKRLPDTILIVDAGLRSPSDAARVMEMGFDAVLVNSAIALAGDPVAMGKAFAEAVRAGKACHSAGMMPRRDLASPSTPTLGTPFWHTAENE